MIDEAGSLALLVALIGAGSAIFGSILGAVISYFTTRYQFRATVLSGNRQQWINTLRDSLADFLSTASLIKADVEDSMANVDDFKKRMERLYLMVSRIKLLINPKEDDHLELVDRIDSLRVAVTKRDTDVSGDVGDITEIGQKVLKREWERVKKGE